MGRADRWARAVASARQASVSACPASLPGTSHEDALRRRPARRRDCAPAHGRDRRPLGGGFISASVVVGPHGAIGSAPRVRGSCRPRLHAVQLARWGLPVRWILQRPGAPVQNSEASTRCCERAGLRPRRGLACASCLRWKEPAECTVRLLVREPLSEELRQKATSTATRERRTGGSVVKMSRTPRRGRSWRS